MSRFARATCAVVTIVVASVIAFRVGNKVAKAEPDSVSEFLLNDPVTMMDWGTYQLEQFVEQFYGNFDGCDCNALVRYDWEQNRIKLTLVIPYGCAANEQDARERAEHYIQDVRLTLRGSREYEVLASTFSHNGFEIRDAPDDFARRLANLVEITVVAVGEPKFKGVKGVGRLTDDETTWED